MLINRSNPGDSALATTDPFIRLGPGAAVVNTELVDNVTVDKGSCVTRSRLGRYFGLGCFSFVANSHIGRYCTFGARVSVGAFSHPTNWLSIHEFQYRDCSAIYGDTIMHGSMNLAPPNAPTEIGHDVWIGDNACVRTGVRIGTGAIIGMGAIVTKDVPPYAIVAGNPARVLRYRFAPELIERLLASRWWELDLDRLGGIDFSDVEEALAAIAARRATPA
ncbi:CatB-related O-acetyltransferase [Massilia sp. TS11]|uniref:CatB-related O-acetyltransferase n=1 Tax=Massilia sp. TS11 TaxID=2908003 RepID=UPI001ED9D5B4|nr:CatB-related O-acetyltransferase [Massilia sp. TS11]MCG2586663.1 CatB-related O-acetyltransferase [Massilia sp. TS11]